MILDDPDQIKIFRLLTLRQGIKLEIKGLKVSRGASAYAIIKAELGLKGSRISVFNQLSEMLGKPAYE
jgi:hypothetical protein